MKKSTTRKNVLKLRGPVYASVGLDVSDRKSCWVALDQEGTAVERGTVVTRSPEAEAMSHNGCSHRGRRRIR